MLRLLIIHESTAPDPNQYANPQANRAAIRGGAERYVDFIASSLEKGAPAHSSIDIQVDILDQVPKSLSSIIQLLQKRSPDIIFLNKTNSIHLLTAIQQLNIQAVRMHHDHEVYCLRKYKYFPWNRVVCTKKAGPCCLIPCFAMLQRNRSSPFGFQLASYRQKMKLIEMDKKIPLHIVSSFFMQQELIRQGYDQHQIRKLTIVPQSTTLAPHLLEKAPGTLLFVGQLVRGKGLDVLLEALAAVKAPFHLHIIGDGPQRPDFQRQALQCNLGSKVTFHGWKEESEIAEYRARACIGIVPSTWPEPFGAVGIEFMRQGVPVIGFQVGAIPEWLIHNKNGLLVPWMDKKLLAHSIEILLNDLSLAFTMGAQAFVTSAQFDAERGITEFAALLTTLFEKSTTIRSKN